VEKKFLRRQKPAGIIVRIVSFPYMWMRKYREIGKQPVDEKCILRRMKSEIEC
jgi:hypothetical protein